MNRVTIESVKGHEIFRFQGNPTVEAQVRLSDGTMGRGAAPSGASTGEFEALELRTATRRGMAEKACCRQ